MELIEEIYQIKKDARLALIKELASHKRKFTYSDVLKGLDDNACSIATENAPNDLIFNRELDPFMQDLNERIFG
jgi:hypothetical protein